MVFLHALESIFSIIIMVSVGYRLAAIGWLNTQTSQLLPRLVNYVALPTFMIWNIMSTFDHEKFMQMGSGLVIPLISMLIAFVISIAVGKIIRIEPNHKGTFRSMFFASSAIFTGLPVNVALFGEASVPYVLMYSIANAALFWTLGVYCITQDGKAGGYKVLSKQTAKNIFSPPLMGFAVAVILVLLNAQLPKFILDTARYLGSLTTPLSMLFIGLVIYGVNLKKLQLTKDMVALLVGRFVISPLLVIGLAYIVPLPLLMKKVFVIQAAMPAMTQTAILSKTYQADPEYAAISTSATTVAAMIAIPIYMVLLQ